MPIVPGVVVPQRAGRVVKEQEARRAAQRGLNFFSKAPPVIFRLSRAIFGEMLSKALS